MTPLEAKKQAGTGFQQFDHCVLSFGYYKFLVPRKAAMEFFELMGTKEVYKLDTWWTESKNLETIELLEASQMPTISTYSVVQFHVARVNAERKAEEERKKAAMEKT